MDSNCCCIGYNASVYVDCHVEDGDAEKETDLIWAFQTGGKDVYINRF